MIMGRTIIVSNRLPVKVHRKDNKITFSKSEGGLATGLGSIYRKNNNLWMGWPGSYFTSDKEIATVKKELSRQSMMPVFLTKQEIRDYYEGFSNEILWPAFHYFPQYAVYDPVYWDAYVKVNMKFCNELASVLKPGDTVWIHDYQLLLLPAMLRERFPNITIGFFLHIPFPSYEILRLLPRCKDILKGMLGADMLGFHTFDYARHFLSSLNRGLGVNNVGGQVLHEGRTIVADAFPMGIDYDHYENLAKSAKAIAHEKKLRKSIGDCRLMLSIDRLDYTKGITERLAAFEQFLTKHPEYQEKVSLMQVLVPSRDKVEMYRQLKEEINRMVGNINSRFGSLTWTPVYYFYRSFPPEQLAAFHRLADVALITPLRDGMNLVAKEYVAARYEKKGAVVLSKLAGAAIELSEAILINPNDLEELTESMHTALTMPGSEQVQRMEAMQAIIRKFNIHHWVDMFMERLADVKEKQKLLLTKAIDNSTLNKIKDQYINASQRLVLLDYDGTLVPFKDVPSQAKPDRELMRLLSKIANDPANKLVIVSGRDKNTMDEWMGHLDADLIAEHGVWIKQGDDEWKQSVPLDASWKEQIRSILEQFCNRTPGALIEEKTFSLAWHYRKVERVLGEHRSRELINHLRYITSNLSVQVLEGDMVVEVKNTEVNKGRAVAKWLENAQDKFILCIGDDFTDEDMFKALPPEAISIKVRSQLSIAKYTMPSYNDVRSLLKKLPRWSSQGGSNSSELRLLRA
jgi:trehalose 6-phosphate synthase/phosphatase